MISIIDTGATHSFISADCVEKLNMEICYMVESKVIDTPTNGSMTTSWICLNFPLTMYGKEFGIDLVFLPLSQLDVIMGMSWLEFNHFHINYFDKSVMSPEIKEGGYMMFMSAKKVDESLKDDTRVFMMFSSLKAKSKVVIGDLPVVCDFIELAPYDISDLAPEREVEFTINLVITTSPLSMAPYRMFAPYLSELKKQLKNILEKKFV
ncbi:uncharacterized protein LOC127103199 [Lathyrus oleraceus]|uniref:uncharacterized protein LOC127103199 n=1 Tax=Pisum sativum TaxID=3888 RepID=UPI0021D25481|nr:uncharacterized protein LOC127103199 [Pisum sativum]